MTASNGLADGNPLSASKGGEGGQRGGGCVVEEFPLIAANRSAVSFTLVGRETAIV